jgi:hypothetical protein
MVDGKQEHAAEVWRLVLADAQAGEHGEPMPQPGAFIHA